MFCMQGKYTPMKVPIWGTCGWRNRDTRANRLKLTVHTIEEGEEEEEDKEEDEEEEQFFSCRTADPHLAMTQIIS